jgi:ketosteroid isomerase-like protein
MTRCEAYDAVFAIIEKWSTAFSSLDAEALSSLYSKKAFFFGSNPRLYRGHDGVKAYFDGLPRWASCTVEFTDRVAELVHADLINFAATALFDVEDIPPLSVKITWAIVREDGDWKIVSHHVSSRTPLL